MRTIVLNLKEEQVPDMEGAKRVDQALAGLTGVTHIWGSSNDTPLNQLTLYVQEWLPDDLLTITGMVIGATLMEVAITRMIHNKMYNL